MLRIHARDAGSEDESAISALPSDRCRSEEWWSREDLISFLAKGGMALLVDGWLIDVTSYLSEHVSLPCQQIVVED